ncbi:MAG TPA: DUF309 domain-containing protein [Acidobacteriota bacterium]|nr:DUF309 domain-containing protein [Acidobacteriota bacterium]
MTQDDDRQSIDQTEARRLFETGLVEFNTGRYFEAHDIWEELWHALRGPDRRYLQALIHLAVGAYHHENHNDKGARSQWQKALAKLDPYPDPHWGVATIPWRTWISSFLNGASVDDHPPGLVLDPDGFPSRLPLAPE